MKKKKKKKLKGMEDTRAERFEVERMEDGLFSWALDLVKRNMKSM